MKWIIGFDTADEFLVSGFDLSLSVLGGGSLGQQHPFGWSTSFKNEAQIIQFDPALDVNMDTHWLVDAGKVFALPVAGWTRDSERMLAWTFTAERHADRFAVASGQIAQVVVKAGDTFVLSGMIAVSKEGENEIKVRSEFAPDGSVSTLHSWPKPSYLSFEPYTTKDGAIRSVTADSTPQAAAVTGGKIFVHDSIVHDMNVWRDSFGTVSGDSIVGNASVSYRGHLTIEDGMISRLRHSHGANTRISGGHVHHAVIATAGSPFEMTGGLIEELHIDHVSGRFEVPITLRGGQINEITGNLSEVGLTLFEVHGYGFQIGAHDVQGFWADGTAFTLPFGDSPRSAWRFINVQPGSDFGGAVVPAPGSIAVLIGSLLMAGRRPRRTIAHGA